MSIDTITGKFPTCQECGKAVPVTKKGFTAPHKVKGGAFCGGGAAPARRVVPRTVQQVPTAKATGPRRKAQPTQGVCRGCAVRRGLTRVGIVAPHTLKGGKLCAGSGKAPETRTARRRYRVIRPPQGGAWGATGSVLPPRTASAQALHGFWAPGRPWHAQRREEE